MCQAKRQNDSGYMVLSVHAWSVIVPLGTCCPDTDKLFVRFLYNILKNKVSHVWHVFSMVFLRATVLHTKLSRLGQS